MYVEWKIEAIERSVIIIIGGIGRNGAIHLNVYMPRVV